MSSWSNDSASTGQHFATDKILIGDVMTTATSLIRADPSDEPWNRVVKLLVLSAVSSIASVANIFVISAVLMEDHLKKRGNVFVVNMALADLIVTGLAIPSATVGLLANFKDWQSICQIQWNCAILTCFVSAPSAAAAAVDARLQIAVGPDRYLGLVTITRLAIIITIIWLSSICALVTFITLDLGPDFCLSASIVASSNTSLPEWNWPLPLAITSVQVLWPTLLTAIVHISCVLSIRLAKRKSPAFLVLPYDTSLMRSNIIVYVLFVVCWSPVVAASAMGVQMSLPLQLYTQLEWVAVAKSCINPFVYAACNKHFRDAFIGLFHYCCCKTSVSFSRRVRADSLRPTSDVRVHIIPGYNVYSAVAQGPNRSTTSTNHRETAKPISRPVKVTKMCKASKKSSGKEVYEL